jgi:hypothetical protein
MSKYFVLTKHLANLDANVWDASLGDIEDALGEPLPDSAYRYPAWWANQGRAQSLAWEGAGWKTKRVDLKNEKVTFVYIGDGVERDAVDTPKLTIAEAKAGLAATFGVSVDAVEITIRG